MSVVVSKLLRALAFAVFTNDKVAQSLCREDLIVKGTSVQLFNAEPKHNSSRQKEVEDWVEIQEALGNQGGFGNTRRGGAGLGNSQGGGTGGEVNFGILIINPLNQINDGCSPGGTAEQLGYGRHFSLPAEPVRLRARAAH